jgi:hypothetical protein
MIISISTISIRTQHNNTAIVLSVTSYLLFNAVFFYAERRGAEYYLFCPQLSHMQHVLNPVIANK